MKGVYQHCAEKHLHRYLSEFDFRYSNRVALGRPRCRHDDLSHPINFALGQIKRSKVP
jgi:hypothetical protein